MKTKQLPIVLALGTTQTLAWASSYYLPAILADPISKELGISSNWFFAAFSGSLIISGLLGPLVGRRIDVVGGREIISISNGLFAAGLCLLGTAHSVSVFLCAWLILGAGMALGLYDAAFAALGQVYGSKARLAITGITLIAGFASTIGWPLTAWGVTAIGWRETCFGWAAAHIFLALPLNLYFLPKGDAVPLQRQASAKPQIKIDRTMIALAFAFATAWSVTSAMAAHLPRILEAAGATSVQAVTAGALIGPAQVLARMIEAGFLGRSNPLTSTKLACLGHPAGAALVALIGGPAVYSFAILHGAGNGILTIARGTLPLAIFGPENYGYRLGILGAPSRLAQAVAPLVFSILLEDFGVWVLLISTLLSLSAFAALCLTNGNADGPASASPP